MKMQNMKAYETLQKKVQTYIKNKEELALIQKAYEYAESMHAGVKRLTGEAYITHPLNVAYILTEIKADAASLCAALLHDVLEDCEVTREELSSIFGEEVTFLVDGVTKINKLNFTSANEAMITNHRKILVGLSEDVRVIIIKLADRLHNLRTLWVHPPKKQKEIAKETLDILAPIAERLGMSNLKSELEDLSLRYYNKEAYYGIVEKLNQTKKERDENVKEMIECVHQLLKKEGIKHEIKGRSKSIYSIYKKMSKGKNIYDLLALRILVHTEADCYAALGFIHAKYKPMPNRFKDYIARPKTNMYQSLHTTVFGEGERLYEIQIRTYEMDEVSEKGIASHWSYKEKGSVKANLQDEMEQKLQFFKYLVELRKEEKDEAEFVNSVKNDILKSSVYVFTPLGDVIELPQGATPIDFAYKVHSKVGDHMVGAIVNDAIVPLDYELKDNDIVKINTNSQSKGPSKEWLSIAKTTGAKNKIKAFFNKQGKEEKIKQGIEIVKEECKKQKINYNDFLKEENISKIIEGTKLSSMDDVFCAIALNKIGINTLHHIIDGKVDSKEKQILKKAENQKVVMQQSHNDILIEGIDDIKVNISSCCKPVPQDPIIGYITKGNGVSIHRNICPNILDKEERIIPVEWNDTTDKKYTSTLMIRALQKENLLLEIISKTSLQNITVQSIISLNKGIHFSYEMTILVENKEALEQFMRSVESMEDVLDIERIIQ